MSGPVARIADRLLLDLAPFDPTAAAAAVVQGLPTDIPALPDHGPEPAASIVAAHRRTLGALAGCTPTDDAERDLAAALAERAASEIALSTVGFGAEQLAPLATAPQLLRERIGSAIDTAVAASGAQESERWSQALDALAALGPALDGHRRTLDDSRDRGLGPARRQVLAVARQCADWIDPAGSNWFAAQVDRAPSGWRERLRTAVGDAVPAMARYRDFLTDDLAPRSPDQDAVGEDVYRVTASAYLGDRVDPFELAAWGADELRRIQAEIALVARDIDPDGPAAAAALLDADPSRRIDTPDGIVDWLETSLRHAADVLDGRFVRLPAPHALPECRVSDSGAGVMYYAPADADGARVSA
ncbi:MAG: DUF885 family protein, partial [Williamsia herbipolensis]|nr:DUF885 family protein [Williamsia herbipolensis]